MNFQNFGVKPVFSSPNFYPDSELKISNSYNAYTPNNLSANKDQNQYSFIPYKKNEDFIKDNISNIEDNGNHSFNSCQFNTFLQPNSIKSHYLDDYELSKQIKTDHLIQNQKEYLQNKEIRSDINSNPYSISKQNDDIIEILDKDLSEVELKDKINFNEFTIQPDLETRSLFLANQIKHNKHGAYSMDMNEDKILDLDLQKNDYNDFYNFSNNSNHEKYHHKVYSGDAYMMGYSDNIRKKETNAGDMISKQEFDRKISCFNEYEPTEKKTNFIDIFKKPEKKVLKDNMSPVKIKNKIGLLLFIFFKNRFIRNTKEKGFASVIQG